MIEVIPLLCNMGMGVKSTNYLMSNNPTRQGTVSQPQLGRNGLSVSADGTVVLAGQPSLYLNNVTTPRGSFTVWRKNGTGWSEYFIFNPHPGPNYSFFASSAVMTPDGNTVFACAYSNNALYNFLDVYRWDGTNYTLLKQLPLTTTANTLLNSATFGNTVSCSDDGLTVVIGAPTTPWTPTLSYGGMFVFTTTNDTWSSWQRSSLIKPSAQGGYKLGYLPDNVTATGASRNYGSVVCINGEGNTIAMSSHFENKVYIFRADGAGGWVQQQTIPYSKPTADTFSSSMAFNGGTLLVGAPTYDLINQTKVDVGRAFLYREISGVFSLVTEIIVPNQTQNGLFGQTLAVSRDGSLGVVGCIYTPTAGFQTSLYKITDTGATSVMKISSDTVSNSVMYGANAAISADNKTLIVTAQRDVYFSGTSRYTPGSLYIYGI